jgi:uncharacterized protein (DUF488 family)
MLTRQKIILGLLDKADGTLSRTKLVKLAFLLQREHLNGRVGAFYDFVPYKYGPFSFTLYHEMNSLERDGYINVSDESVRINPDLSQSIKHLIAELPQQVTCAVTGIFERHGKRNQKDLIKEVYANYPWFASRSELQDLKPAGIPKRSCADPAIYTVGYESSSVDSLLNQILYQGISCIADVRSNPVSRKYGFGKRVLSANSKKLGIEYDHWPLLGIPGEFRKPLTDYESYQQLLRIYEKEFLPKQELEVMRLAKCMKKTPTVLLCMEKDVNICHRGKLAECISKLTALPVCHLGLA